MVLLAFGWTNPLMLGWLAAAALPLLVHLLRRRRYREVSWAAMRWLRAAIEHETRRVRLEQWGLLALRTLFIVLVVLAAAGPRLQSATAIGGAGDNCLRLLVIDGSYSMGYRWDDQTLFGRAKSLAQRMVREGGLGDAYMLVLMAERPVVAVDRPSKDRLLLAKRIEELSLSESEASLPATLLKSSELLESADRDGSRFSRAEVIIVSDLQAKTWSPAAESRDELRHRFERLAAKTSVRVINVGVASAENIAVSQFKTEDPLTIVGRPAALQATLENFGSQLHRQAVELWADGRQVGQQAVEIPARGSALVEFPRLFDEEREHRLEIRAPGDRLEIDNRRFLIVSPRKQVRVLCVDGRPSGRPYQGAADYLALGLAPSAKRELDLLRVETVGENGLIDRDLRDYDCLFLCNVSHFTAGQAQRLDSYLRDGGSIVFFLGEHVDPERYHDVLGVAGESKPGPGGGAGLRLLPARLERLVSGQSSQINPLGFRHPMLKAWRGREEEGFAKIPVWKYYRLKVSEAGPARKVLALDNGDPLLVEQNVHRGRVLLVATSADPGWSALPLVPHFVPLVRSMALWCAAGAAPGRTGQVGQPFDVFLAAHGGQRVQLPDGRVQMIRPDAGSARIATQSGMYTVLGQATTGNKHFAINVDTAESDLAKVDESRLRAMAPGVAFNENDGVGDAGSASAALARHNQSLRLDTVLLFVALAVALGETFCAWRFGHSRRKASIVP